MNGKQKKKRVYQNPRSNYQIIHRRGGLNPPDNIHCMHSGGFNPPLQQNDSIVLTQPPV
jgi:hypothetical protein